MIENEIRGFLPDAVNEVLERMFFVQAMGESPRQLPDGPDGQTAASVRFDGDPSGSLTLWLTAEAALPIAADFLGSDPEEITDQRSAEVICELANMICGSLLSRIEAGTTFRLAAPRILLDWTPAEFAGATFYAVELENGILAVGVTIGIPTCLEPAPSAY